MSSFKLDLTRLLGFDGAGSKHSDATTADEVTMPGAKIDIVKTRGAKIDIVKTPGARIDIVK